ncbi:hypothetical protein N7450_011616 [Penicillium hetheringtonii]|uniref:Uncharacterized protein n=1 Tax=Penicillium hetheringtonii TaxID=911720 RepID=A0AAD6DB75_9EURO|nr:hypothetical protein N7450_011616 [Penicillium hetheringtonii]
MYLPVIFVFGIKIVENPEYGAGFFIAQTATAGKKRNSDVSSEICSENSTCCGTPWQQLSPVNGRIDSSSEHDEGDAHISFSEMAREIQAMRDESLQLKAHVANFEKRCDKLEANLTALQRKNQRLEGMNTLMEGFLRRERETNDYLVSHCASQEDIMCHFSKDLPNLQSELFELRETWEDIGKKRAKK